MMIRHFSVGILLLISFALPQMLSAEMVGEWLFTDGKDTVARVGNDLERVTRTGNADFTTVSGLYLGDGAVRVGQNNYYKCLHGLPKGAVYSVVMDVRAPAETASTASYHALFQPLAANGGDPAYFLCYTKTDPTLTLWYKKGTTIALPGATLDQWNRYVITWDGTNKAIYLNGQLIQTDADTKLCILEDNSWFYFFADNNGEDLGLDVTYAAVYDETLSAETIAADHVAPQAHNAKGEVLTDDEATEVVGEWLFTAGSETVARVGNDLERVTRTGSENFQVVPGIYVGDGAIRANLNNAFKCTHGLPVGSSYTVVMDVNAPTATATTKQYHSIFQPLAANNRDPAYFLCYTSADPTVKLWYAPQMFETLDGVTLDQWNRYVITWDDESKRRVIYLNGQEVLVDSLTPTREKMPITDAGYFYFLADNDGDDYGLDITYAALYDRALTAEEIARFHTAPVAHDVDGNIIPKKNYVAQVGETMCETFAEAMDLEGDITILGTIEEAVTLTRDVVLVINDDIELSTVFSGNFGLSKKGAGELTITRAQTFTGDFVVEAGKVSASAAVRAKNANAYIEVKSGANLTFTTGVQVDSGYKFKLAGSGLNGEGALVMAGAGNWINNMQITSIELTDDATVGLTIPAGSGGTGFIASGHGASSLILNGHTFTKKGVQPFFFCNTTVSDSQNTGKIVIEEGAIELVYAASTINVPVEGKLDIQAALVHVVNSGKTSEFEANVNAKLTKAGAGTLTLKNTSTLGQNAKFAMNNNNAGTLEMTDAFSVTCAGAITVEENKVLPLEVGSWLKIVGGLKGSGTLNLSGSATISLNSDDDGIVVDGTTINTAGNLSLRGIGNRDNDSGTTGDCILKNATINITGGNTSRRGVVKIDGNTSIAKTGGTVGDNSGGMRFEFDAAELLDGATLKVAGLDVFNVTTQVPNKRVVGDGSEETPYSLMSNYVTITIPEIANTTVSVEGGTLEGNQVVVDYGAVISVTYTPNMNYEGGGTVTLTAESDVTLPTTEIVEPTLRTPGEVTATSFAFDTFKVADKLVTLMAGDTVVVPADCSGDAWHPTLTGLAGYPVKVLKPMNWKTEVGHLTIGKDVKVFLWNYASIPDNALVDGEGILAICDNMTVSGNAEVATTLYFGEYNTAGTILKLADNATLKVVEKLAEGKVTTDVEGKNVVFDNETLTYSLEKKTYSVSIKEFDHARCFVKVNNGEETEYKEAIIVNYGDRVDFRYVADANYKINGTANFQFTNIRSDIGTNLAYTIEVVLDVTTIAIPEAPEGSKVEVTVDGVPVTVENNEITATIGAQVVVTYSAQDGYRMEPVSTTLVAGSETEITVPEAGAIVRIVAAKIGTDLYPTLQAAIDAASTGDVITLLQNFSTDEAITVRGKAVEIRTEDYKTAKTPTVGLRVNYMDANKITATTIIYFRKPAGNTSTPTEIDRMIVGDFEDAIGVVTEVNENESVRYDIGLHEDVTLTKDLEIPDGFSKNLPVEINIKANVTFDINGHTLTQKSGRNGGWSNLPLFCVNSAWSIPLLDEVTFTLKDSKKTGTIYVPLHAVHIENQSTVNIQDVNIVYGHNCTKGDVTQDEKSGGQAVVVFDCYANGVVNFTGESSIRRDENCILTGKYPWSLLPYAGGTINVESGYYDGMMYGGSGFGTINIMGGTYSSPQIKWYTADGYSPANNGEDLWTIVPDEQVVASIGLDCFTDLLTAVNYSEAGDTIHIEKDNTTAVTIPVGVTIKLHGFTTGELSAPEGYEIVDGATADEKTVARKPIIIDFDGQTTAPIKVSEAWIAANVGADATTEQIKAKLESSEANGLKVWQNYVMGVDGSNESNVLKPIEGAATPEEKDGKTEPIVIAAPLVIVNPPTAADSKIAVVYQLYMGTMGEDGKIVWASVPTLEAAAPRFALDFADKAGDTYWKIAVVFTSVE